MISTFLFSSLRYSHNHNYFTCLVSHSKRTRACLMLLSQSKNNEKFACRFISGTFQRSFYHGSIKQSNSKPVDTSAKSIMIGDVKVNLPTNSISSGSPASSSPQNKKLIPKGNLSRWGNDFDSPDVVGHLRWMAQKLSLKQDMFLAGGPSPLRRHLVLTLAELCNYEVEVLTITRDTTESDLKQRREIVGDSVIFSDQPPVRAAIHGRLLIVDGIENAERNVLPTLNNLLENREMALEDGRFLMRQDTYESIINDQQHEKQKNLDNEIKSRFVPVSNNFTVIALGLPVPPYQGRSLDPPLRSRFQSRFVDELNIENVIACLTGGNWLHFGLPKDLQKVQKVANLYEGLRNMRLQAMQDASGVTSVPILNMNDLQHILTLLSRDPKLSFTEAISRSLPLGYTLKTELYKFLLLKDTHSNSQVRKQTNLDVYRKDAFSVGMGLPPKLFNTFQALLQDVFEQDLANETLLNSFSVDSSTLTNKNNLTPSQNKVLFAMYEDIRLGRPVCLHGGQGVGKSKVVSELASMIGLDETAQKSNDRENQTANLIKEGGKGKRNIRVFPLYKDMSARDLLQTRNTTTTTSNNVILSPQTSYQSTKRTELSITSWRDSPLVEAIRNGDICVLDGIDRIDIQSLLQLKRLIHDGELDLPSGERLSKVNIYSNHPEREEEGAKSGSIIHPDFKLIALGLPPRKAEDAKARYMTSDLGFSYHYLNVPTSSEIPQILGFSSTSNTEQTFGVLENDILGAFEALQKTAMNGYPELQPSLRQLARLYSNMQLDSRSNSKRTRDVNGRIVRLFYDNLMIRYLSLEGRAQFEEAMKDAGLLTSSLSNISLQNKFENDLENMTTKNAIEIDSLNGTLTIGSVCVPQRKVKAIELVPQPLFFENDSQIKLMEQILRSYATGEMSILLIGNQGVGKNKLTDRILQLLSAEREYMQLHRDTTISSLTVIPSLQNGRIEYQDSPLIRAAKEGRFLILDEVDKASLEVVCLLKGLIGDGEIVLADGKRLLSYDRINQLYDNDTSSPNQNNSNSNHKSFNVNEELGNELSKINNLSQSTWISSELRSFCERNSIIPIHPDFRLIALANRPGHPFLGNNFFAVCGDLFSCHIIENPDIASEVALLSKFAPNVSLDVLTRLAKSFADLRNMHETGIINYPFSAREAVAVARHAERYPNEGVEVGVEDILGFDGMNPRMRALVVRVLQKHGFNIASLDYPGYKLTSGYDAEGKAYRIRGSGGESLVDHNHTSTPKTSSNMPKHGKHDPDNTPHVGGNTWAGGSGGSDTAGLGGRGGPYRLDSGHPVHQISDEEKAKVSKESRERAAQMAKEGLEKRLKEIKMGKHDYKTYKRYSERVQTQVGQIQDILEETSRRNSERIWLNNQGYGDLDDGKIVDSLAGERLVFKRRGYDQNNLEDGSIGDQFKKRKVQFVMDVSGSMMRFNGYDRRLERMLESTLMILEALPRPIPQNEFNHTGTEFFPDNQIRRNGSYDNVDLNEVIEYSIMGHSGDTANELFVDFPHNNSSNTNHISEVTTIQQQNIKNNKTSPFDMFFGQNKIDENSSPPPGPFNENEKMAILERMIAHSQFCFPGDNTLSATEIAINRCAKSAVEGDGIERLVIVISDANFRRYQIDPHYVSQIMRSNPNVSVHMILIAGLRDEAEKVAEALPLGRAHLCLESSNLPAILKKILNSNLNM